MKPPQKAYWVMGGLVLSGLVVGGVFSADHATQAIPKQTISKQAISKQAPDKTLFEAHLKAFERGLSEVKVRPFHPKDASSTPLEGLAIWQSFLPQWTSPTEADQAFLVFKRTYEKWVNDPSYAPITQQYDVDKLFSANNEAYWQQISKDAEAKGFLLDLLEGDVYFSSSPAFLTRHCQQHLSPALQEGLAIQSQYAGSYVNDAAITIEWDDIRKRRGVLEAYLRKYPETPLKAEFEADLKGYFYHYLNGMDNTPLYLQEGQGPDQQVTLAPDIQKSYEAFLQQNVSSRYDAPMAEFYALLKSHQFKFKVDPNQDYRGLFYAKTFPHHVTE